MHVRKQRLFTSLRMSNISDSSAVICGTVAASTTIMQANFNAET